MRAGFIGLGRMGRPMAINMRRKGFELTVHDINNDAIAALEAEGARRGNGVAGVAAASDVVYTMLPGPKEVEEVIAGADGVLSHLKPGSIVVDMSTVDPLVTDKIAALCAEKGVGFVDAPVGRLAQHADRGECLFMVGGSDEDIARVMPIFDTLRPPGDPADGFVHAGPVGAGHYAKMVHNGIEYGLMMAYAEGYELLAAEPLITDTQAVIQAWTNGTVVRSWLQQLLAKALKEDPGLADISDYTEDSGEGRWTVEEAIHHRVPVPVIAASLFARFASRQDQSPTMKAVSALRNQFGGHAVQRVRLSG